jgi:hypothetical protein
MSEGHSQAVKQKGRNNSGHQKIGQARSTKVLTLYKEFRKGLVRTERNWAKEGHSHPIEKREEHVRRMKDMIKQGRETCRLLKKVRDKLRHQKRLSKEDSLTANHGGMNE